MDGPNPYYDENYGDNIWDYYFEPVAGYTYQDISKMLLSVDNPLNDDDIVKLSRELLWYIHAGDPASIYNYPYGYYINRYEYEADWYTKQRTKANRLIKKYVRIKKNIQRDIDDFYNSNFKGNKILGIHMRGTDKGIVGLHPPN